MVTSVTTTDLVAYTGVGHSTQYLPEPILTGVQYSTLSKTVLFQLGKLPERRVFRTAFVSRGPFQVATNKLATRFRRHWLAFLRKKSFVLPGC